MWKRHLMQIAWPGFLAACALELVVFAVVDPAQLDWAGRPVGWSRQGVYTASFFVFWIISMAGCALTALLGSGQQPADDEPRP